eukprot:1946874-Rhodomonas_salina.1
MSVFSVYSPRGIKSVCPSVDFGFTTTTKQQYSEDATVAGRNSSFSFEDTQQPSSKALTLKSSGSHDDNMHSSASTLSCSSLGSEPSSAPPTSHACEPVQRDVVIKPRRRAGQGLDDKECVPITITVEVLESLYCKPLNAAAKTIGISITAFKKVCRSLGVRNWPYRFQEMYTRSTPHVTTPKPAEQQVPETTMKVEENAENERDQEEEIKVEESTALRALLEHSKEVWGNVTSCKEKDEVGETPQGWLVCPLDGSKASEALSCGWDFEFNSENCIE